MFPGDAADPVSYQSSSSPRRPVDVAGRGRRGPPRCCMVRTEGAIPTAWVYVDVADRDIGGFVADAKRMVGQMVDLPPGYRLEWSGQFEYMERARERM